MNGRHHEKRPGGGSAGKGPSSASYKAAASSKAAAGKVTGSGRAAAGAANGPRDALSDTPGTDTPGTEKVPRDERRQALSRSHGKDRAQARKQESGRSAVAGLPVSLLPCPPPQRPFWEDVDYAGLKAMPVTHHVFRLRHERLGLSVPLGRCSVQWHAPMFPGHDAGPRPRKLWLGLLQERSDWEALLKEDAFAARGMTLDELFSPGLMLEFCHGTAEGVLACRYRRIFTGVDEQGRPKWHLDFGDSETSPDGRAWVIEIFEDNGCHIWEAGAICTSLAALFDDAGMDTAVLEALDSRFDAWSASAGGWPGMLRLEDPHFHERCLPAGFDWTAYHRIGIRLAMEVKAVLGRQATVIYKGNVDDPSWPALLQLVIDVPLRRRQAGLRA
jgi:hypothetical protein